ncbi:TPA: N(2)-acetyl-L-2,4-diaminobutanoate deacetylase DoeB [Burkholderia vietnamiensis]|uniref:N-alpha-acetyl diaminobutyric acid deacetylase DoeB n=1 Tax=Burkholderia vietnamiensis TaxID=60552 RepID=A0AA44XXT2_BURVI|nr:N(2)-acetyl-L-2,4-diaminobutanoate deacetylase DoeB [Burkholderia vietnamiensis]KVF72068.1 N-alpha-acetyl diaminobutyric acid deacetylase DoeB [Burkholderia vietnamiensis]KVR94853.1 N-alpha-acetyl diaminobutyric acid deacetylase DoeB [Burkholderia vietnamiensis]KVS21007.1 N-alpha-acetyl diaminobutyric acid deacetylase DoeB [Burkholderia vietnamiensis]MBJ9689510.1 N-alpha-acetyl diaminobutyric acid deacetylase DoeB [Burkholderia vietnamiensis]MCA8209988.1 N(2)-acetyl-L-2,4-diaminobutanoate d
MRASPITPTVDLDADGVQHGFLKLPYSRDDSAWGAIMIPIAVVKRGDGPTVLLTGGNHGDEYEGPVALSKLAGSLKAADVTGRVIVVPFMNYPAFRAGRRTSPIDAGNLNRSFPGRPDGTVTEKIADYFQRHLLPLATHVLDIHAGGRTLDFVPFAAIHVLENREQEARCERAMRAFGAPYSMRMLELDSVGLFDTAAEAAGKVFVSTELGGGGTSTAASVAIAERGVRGFLEHAGVLAKRDDASAAVRAAPRTTTLLDMPDGSCFTTSEHRGLLEMCRDLGSEVEAGDVLARVHDIDRTGGAPVEYVARRRGLLAARHFPGLVQAGDTIAVVADIVERNIPVGV